MRPGDEERVAIHEAGHAVAYLSIGRPILRAVVREHEHYVLPVPGARVHVGDEAVAIASGWAAEERRLRLMNTDDVGIENVWMNGGQHDDHSKLEALAAKVEGVSVEESEQRAARLVAAHWDLIIEVAGALLKESELDQNRMVAIAERHEVFFNPGDQATSRTGKLLDR